MAHLFKVHTSHRTLHPFHYPSHAACHLPHGDGGLDSAGDGIDPGPEAEEIEFFILLADGILGVDLGDVGVVLLDCLERRSCGSIWSPL